MIERLEAEGNRTFLEITGTDYDGIYCYYEDGDVYIENGSSLDTACDIAKIVIIEFMA